MEKEREMERRERKRDRKIERGGERERNGEREKWRKRERWRGGRERETWTRATTLPPCRLTTSIAHDLEIERANDFATSASNVLQYSFCGRARDGEGVS